MDIQLDHHHLLERVFPMFFKSLNGIRPPHFFVNWLENWAGSTPAYNLTGFIVNRTISDVLLLHLNILFFREGFVVIKVFAIHDPSLPLKVYQDQISFIKRRLSGVANVLPFQGALLTDKAGLLFRQYVHDNLYDRIR